MAIIVELSRAEWTFAALKGVERQIDGVLRGSKHRYGQTKDPYQQNIQGCCGELAVAKLLGVDWDGSYGNFKARDAGRFQVRTTMREGGNLIIYPGDNQKHTFILVTGVAPVLTVVGAATAYRVCTRTRLLVDGRWQIRQSDLTPIEELLKNEGIAVNQPTLR